MAITVKHQFVSAKVDTLDSSRVQPSNWNAGHDIQVGPAVVIGRGPGVGQADAQEIPMGAMGQTLLATATAAAARAAIVADDSQTTIAAAAAKVTPVDADVVVILDSAAANVFKRVTWANIKATLLAYLQPTLKTYFDTLYVPKTDPVASSESRGVKLQVVSASQVTLTADAVSVEDATGKFVRILAVNVTANLTAAGANGLDAGGEAASTWYYAWLIWNGVTSALLLSTSATAPTMPGGYTHKKLIGAIRNDSSANLWRTLQYGKRTQLTIGTTPTVVPVMISGVSGDVNTPTWTAVSLASFIPPIACSFYGTLSCALGDNLRAMVAPSNAYGAWNSTNSPPFSMGIIGAGTTTNIPVDMIVESGNVYYASNNGGSQLTLNGWELNL